MKHIRPWEFFGDKPDRVAQITVPHRRGAGGISLLETMCLMAAIHKVQAKTVFEFGTFLGATTLNFARNLPPDGRVYTFDLAPGEVVEQHPADAPLTEQHHASRMDFEGSLYESKVTQIFGNSHSFDPSGLQGCCDLVFVDGGHDAATIKADTESAFALARKGGIIFWHDYRGPEYPEVTRFLDELNVSISHIEETKLAFHCAS